MAPLGPFAATCGGALGAALACLASARGAPPQREERDLYTQAREEWEAQAKIMNAVTAAALLPSAILFVRRAVGGAWRWRLLLWRRRQGPNGKLWPAWLTRAARAVARLWRGCSAERRAGEDAV